jgi:glycosyltransferase involved in cell wall biosynthesis
VGSAVNVLFANATHRWGGVKTWTLAVGRGLVLRGHQVDIVLRPGDPFGEPAAAAGFTVHRLAYGPDWNPLAIGWFSARLGSGGADLVVTNVGKDNRTAAVAARIRRIPVIHRVGGPGDLRDTAAIRWTHRHLVDRILVPSQSTRSALLENSWIIPDQVRVIESGIDLERFRPGQGQGVLRREIGARPHEIVIGTTGQFTAVKGHRHLLDALALLVRDNVPVRAALIGTGPLEAPLLEQAERLGLAGRVHFPGFRRDLPELLEDVDIAVQPSLMEGLPHSVIEFLAKGIPVVASRLDGIAEAVEEGRSGLLVPAEDAGALARSIGELAGDRPRREAMGQAARDRAVKRFDAARMIEEVESFFGSVSRRRDA